jgi:hypothetical protein
MNVILWCDHLVLDLMYCGLTCEVQFCSRKCYLASQYWNSETVAHIYFHLSENEFNGLHYTNRGVFITRYRCTRMLRDESMMQRYACKDSRVSCLSKLFSRSLEECGRYLETIKVYENKPADNIREHMDNDYLSRVCMLPKHPCPSPSASLVLFIFNSMFLALQVVSI